MSCLIKETMIKDMNTKKLLTLRVEIYNQKGKTQKLNLNLE